MGPVAKSFMNWKMTGSPRQLEVQENNSIKYITRAVDIATIMNEYFIGKVQKIVKSFPQVPLYLSGYLSLMNAKKISLSFNYVTVHKVRRILKSLKNKIVHRLISWIIELSNLQQILLQDHCIMSSHCQ